MKCEALMLQSFCVVEDIYLLRRGSGTETNAVQQQIPQIHPYGVVNTKPAAGLVRKLLSDEDPAKRGVPPQVPKCGCLRYNTGRHARRHSNTHLLS
jgi:hypothetical protein